LAAFVDFVLLLWISWIPIFSQVILWISIISGTGLPDTSGGLNSTVVQLKTWPVGSYITTA